MQLDKVAVGTQEVVATHVRQKTWQLCAFSCSSFTGPHFLIGSKLGKWFDPYLVRKCVQTATGQRLAVEVAIENAQPGSTIPEKQFSDLCAACGLWCLIVSEALPQLAIGSDAVTRLEQTFRTSKHLREEVLSLRGSEPENEIMDASDLVNWVIDHVHAIREARDESARNANRQVARARYGMNAW